MALRKPHILGGPAKPMNKVAFHCKPFYQLLIDNQQALITHLRLEIIFSKLAWEVAKLSSVFSHKARI